MKISIITPTLNQAEFINDTIQSVMAQDYSDYEHIIIDGGSTDGTLEILKKYPHLRWVSERDHGQGNAINKGFRIAGGEILAWINSDDYYDKNIFKEVASIFKEHKDCQFLYGDIIHVDKNGTILKKFSGKNLSYDSLLKNPNIVRQPSCFWRKEILENIGFLNEQLHLVMDFDFFLRILKYHEPFYLNRNISFYRHYPNTKTNRMLRKQAKEMLQVMRSHGKINFLFLLCRYVDSFNDANPLKRMKKALANIRKT